jgi:dTDP-glucose pyrophosphorylase
MKKVGISRVIIVVGHLGHEIARIIGSGSQLGMVISYVEQGEVLGIAHALGQLEQHVDAPFLLFLGDIFFQTDGIEEAVASFRKAGSGSMLIVKEEADSNLIRKNFAVILDAGTGLVRRVIEKPRYIQNRLKGCGLYLFDLPIFDAVRRTPRTAMRNEYEITDAIQILIDDGEPVRVAKVVKSDVNLTVPHDLLICNLLELDRRGLDTVVHPTAKIDSSVKVGHSVIGSGVCITGSIALQNCVIFADTVMQQVNGALEGYIVTPEAAIECRRNPVVG